MQCDAVLSALATTAPDAWPPGIPAHLAGCESCASTAIEWTLRQAPPVEVSPAFAADVARHARLAEPMVPRRAIAPTAGFVAAGVLIGACAVWMATSGEAVTVAPVAAMLLAGGEAIVFAAWSQTGGVLDAPGRPARR